MNVEINAPRGHVRIATRSPSVLPVESLGGVSHGHRRQLGLVNAMTIDVEDYFQVQALSHRFRRQDWPTIECRVERNTMRILEMLAAHQCAATFFTLGWI